MRAHDFEERHHWIGDSIETESAAFQVGKARALEKLLRFTSPDSDEAGSVVLKHNGEEFDFQIGSRDEVETLLPPNEIVAVLHSHPDGFPHSVRDWFNLLNEPLIDQSHVVSAHRTYSLHKPSNWIGVDIISEGVIEVALSNALTTIAIEQLQQNSNLTEAEFYERATGLMAKQYGIIYRIGERRD